ncbi:hypothetical protein [Cellulomonas flavigena]|uniref:hypothetical protein n=1 Tax=Cellulomonas flavigena TaxID=1711 RepID=UPI0011D2B3C5|nr:hypothetical protein [Cellulomonas flavigena]
MLPADWHVVDLATDATRHAGVTALVDAQLPRRDDVATVRRRLRRDVEEQSRRAAQAGGRFSAYMLDVVGPVPLPAVITAYRTPGALATDDDLRALADTLTARLGPAGTVDAGAGPLGPVLRAVSQRPAADEHGPDLLVGEYWSDPDDGDGLLLLSFSTPLVGLRDAVLELFDTVAGSVHHVDGTPAAARGR